jgi:GrpB-like predicted nucleotidyltransferase (UPF0157 family)
VQDVGRGCHATDRHPPIQAYDPAWPARFAELAAGIGAALGGTAVAVEHVGSTAVPGLAAKPVIDIQIQVRSFEPFDAYGRPSRASVTSTSQMTSPATAYSGSMSTVSGP